MLPRLPTAAFVLSLAALVTLVTLTASPTGAASTLADCARQFQASPLLFNSAGCFNSEHNKGAALEQIERLVRNGYGDNPWLRSAEARILAVSSGGSGRAEVLYRVAAAGFAAGGLPAEDAARGELTARGNLCRLLLARGALSEARFELERARRAVARFPTSTLLARADLLEARQLFNEGVLLEQAVSLLLEARKAPLERAHRIDLLNTLGGVYLKLNRLEPARIAYQEARRLAEAPPEESSHLLTALYGQARIEVERLALLPNSGGGARERVIALARKTQLAARQGENRALEANSLWLLARALGGQKGEEFLSTCLEIATEDRTRSQCLVARADLAATAGRRRQARADLAEARARAGGLNLPWFQALIRSQMQVSWEVEPPERAIAESWEALKAIEALRRHQGRGSEEQADVFASWAYPFHQFAGLLLRTVGEHPERLAEAFSVLERLHARALLDTLHPPELDLPPDLSKRLDDIEQARAATAERQRDPTVPESERHHAAKDLQILEAKRAGFARLLERPRRALGSPFVSLAEVQRRLAPDEGMLVFQVAPEKGWGGHFAGGSWLIALTRSTPPRLYRLPERELLRGALSTWESAIAEQEPDEPRIAARLYERLLKQALADLPPSIRRLVVIPDDHLHRLPWAALRRHAGGPPLVTDYQISLTPSATLWYRQRNRPFPSPRNAAALIFAAPLLTDRLHLEPLPEAQREGRDVRRALPGDSLLLVGDRAAESALTSQGIARFNVLHFATHSEVNERHPQNSAVHLARGGGGDGRLTPAEIARLPLADRLVVLSSCEGQAGRVLLGEGTLSLARAFFQGHTRTVVASLWKVRDDDARVLSASFYRHLGAGASTAAAVAAAQRERARAGAPAAAWAGLVVLGDGDLTPVAPRRRGWGGPLALLAAAALGAVRGWRDRERHPAGP